MARSGLGGPGRRGRSSGAVASFVLGVVLATALVSEGDPATSSDRLFHVYLGILLGYVALNVRSLLVLALAKALGADVPLMIVGSGPVLRRMAGPTRVTVLRALPLSFALLYSARREHFSRDMRLMAGTGMLAPLVGACVPAALLPGDVTAAMLAMVGHGVLRIALRKVRGSGRRTFQRVFFRTTPERDRQFYDRRWLDFNEASQAMLFGDLATETASRHPCERMARGRHGGASPTIRRTPHSRRGSRRPGCGCLRPSATRR
jgi:hypothetical protein